MLTLGSDAATAGSARGLRVECAPELCFSERSSQAAVWRGGESAAATTDAADGAERAALPGSGARRVVRILLPDV